MKRKKRIFILVLLVLITFSYLEFNKKQVANSKYTVTYQLPGGYAKTLDFDESFKSSFFEKDSPRESTNRIYSSFLNKTVSSTRMPGANLYKICTNDECVDYENKFHENSYSQKIFETSIGVFDIRMYPEDNGVFNSEIVNVSTGKVTDLEGSFSNAGISYKNKILLSGENNNNQSLYVEIDVNSMEVTKKIEIDKIKNNAEYLEPYAVNYNEELYFYAINKKMLQRLDERKKEFVDSEVKNPLPIRNEEKIDPMLEVKQLGHEGKQYYVIQNKLSEVYITDLEKSYQIKNTYTTAGFLVYTHLYDKNKKKFLLLLLPIDDEKQIRAQFVEFNLLTFEAKTLSSNVVKQNLQNVPTITMNY